MVRIIINAMRGQGSSASNDKCSSYKAHFPILMCLFLLAACSISPVEKSHFKFEGGVADFDGIKIAVGQPAPDFTLSDMNGKQVSLSSFKGKKHVLLVVYRGNWCPYCMSQLDSFESLLPLLGRFDIQLVGVSPDLLKKVDKTTKKFDSDYIFLGDEKMEMIDLYGLRKDATLPHPATILINSKGEVVWFYASSDFKVRPDAMQMRKIIGKHLRNEGV